MKPESGALLFVVQLIGTVAFSISGSVTSIHRRLDLFGTLILGVVTACGGGVIRDMMIGVLPPRMFADPFYAEAAVLTALAVFLLVRFHVMQQKTLLSPKYEAALNLTDAIGLGAFTVVGCDIAYSAGYADNLLLSCFLGVTTGVGGGLLRDVLSGHTPAIFVKHIYAVASLCGALGYCLLFVPFGRDAAMITGALAVIVIRILAAVLQWNLPRALLDGDAEDGK